MIIKLIPPSAEDIALHQLPERGMVVDLRPICRCHLGYKFKVVVKGTRLKIIKIKREKEEVPGWPDDMRFRVYNKNEFQNISILESIENMHLKEQWKSLSMLKQSGT